MLLPGSFGHSSFNDISYFALGGSRVRVSKEIRSLGVVLDSSLTLLNHLAWQQRKVTGNLINIYRIPKFLDQSCNSLFCELHNKDLRPLQMLISSAARVAKGDPQYSRECITPVCMSLHFLPMKARIKFKICLLIFKALNIGDPKYISDLLKPRANSTEHLIRSSSRRMLFEPRISQLNYVKRSFEYNAPRMFNVLPEEIRRSANQMIFKKKLKPFLFLVACNSVTSTVTEDYAV